jgi:hypothetical protein
MISLTDILSNFVDSLLVLVWDYLRTLGRCIFGVRTGMYRTLLRGYRPAPGRTGLATFSVINLVICFVLLPNTPGAFLYFDTNSPFSQVLALKGDNWVGLYLLGGAILFSLLASGLIWTGISVARRVRRTANHLSIDEFRFLRAMPLLIVSTGLLMLFLLLVFVPVLSNILNSMGDTGSGYIALVRGMFLIVAAYGFAFWPAQGLLLYRKSTTRIVGRSLIIFCTLLLSPIAAFFISTSVVTDFLNEQRREAQPVSGTRESGLTFGGGIRGSGVFCDVESSPDNTHAHIYYVRVSNLDDFPRLVTQIALQYRETRQDATILNGDKNGHMIVKAKATEIAMVSVQLDSDSDLDRDLDRVLKDPCHHENDIQVEIQFF